MKIPSKAKRVFKGEIFEVYQWKQKLFDGTIAIFEGLRRKNTTQIIAVQDDKIIINLQMQPGKRKFLSLFGGRQEKNETPLACAKRELAEEAGLASTEWELWKVYFPISKIEWKIYLFIARNCKSIGTQHLDAGEKITIKKLSFKQFISIVETESFGARDFSLDILRMKFNGTLSSFEKKLFRKKVKKKIKR